ncbi:uncharacterized protein LOC127358760 [Dicentrarchus labrax]|uniref:uncharacterized protein LOC127358760 n=1 Tax=Dicentrarchus labrax TaxID=13489 RepID=UPI0021F63898|nr:uncharacterized protein LOC127358760 [Dicentrarchus labrax]
MASSVYKWEFMADEGRWTEYQGYNGSFDSKTLERHYHLNPRGKLHFTIRKFSYTLDFARMEQINHKYGTRRAVRRIVDGTSEYDGSAATPTSQWQFQDKGGIWKEYTRGRCSTSSQDIQSQYQKNPTGSMMFTVKNVRYKLNFADMTQTNLSTRTTRLVRRLFR